MKKEKQINAERLEEITLEFAIEKNINFYTNIVGDYFALEIEKDGKWFADVFQETLNWKNRISIKDSKNYSLIKELAQEYKEKFGGEWYKVKSSSEKPVKENKL